MVQTFIFKSKQTCPLPYCLKGDSTGNTGQLPVWQNTQSISQSPTCLAEDAGTGANAAADGARVALRAGGCANCVGWDRSGGQFLLLIIGLYVDLRVGGGGQKRVSQKLATTTLPTHPKHAEKSMEPPARPCTYTQTRLPARTHIRMHLPTRLPTTHTCTLSLHPSITSSSRA